jgi:hypothetical protein
VLHGYRRYGYYPYRGYYWPIRPVIAVVVGPVRPGTATAIGGGPIIAVTGSLAWIDQGRSASRWS